MRTLEVLEFEIEHLNNILRAQNSRNITKKDLKKLNKNIKKGLKKILKKAEKNSIKISSLMAAQRQGIERNRRENLARLQRRRDFDIEIEGARENRSKQFLVEFLCYKILKFLDEFKFLLFSKF